MTSWRRLIASPELWGRLLAQGAWVHVVRRISPLISLGPGPIVHQPRRMALPAIQNVPFAKGNFQGAKGHNNDFEHGVAAWLCFKGLNLYVRGCSSAEEKFGTGSSNPSQEPDSRMSGYDSCRHGVQCSPSWYEYLVAAMEHVNDLGATPSMDFLASLCAAMGTLWMVRRHWLAESPSEGQGLYSSGPLLGSIGSV